jgi:NAD(P)-dependent dehydrogenase (short-subunit alcohol dehydrogenase family)
MSADDQVPTKSGFHTKSSGAEVTAGVDLSGKTAIVTGGYSGIGLETVRCLADRGARVIVPVRSPEKAKAALDEVSGQIETAALDLSVLATVRRFCTQMVADLSQLDLLINNAGIMACPEARVGPGWESQFGVNHMGHFALTKGLMPLIEKADAPRVVALSSTAHKVSDILWDDIHYAHNDYDKWQAYGQAKTANALFANALSRRLKGQGGHAFSVHPGGIFTPLQRHLPKEEMIALGWLDKDGEPSELAKQGFKTPEQGCSTTLWAATSSALDAKPGVYCEDCDIAALTDPESPTARYFGVNLHACDDAAAEKLWEISEELLAGA